MGPDNRANSTMKAILHTLNLSLSQKFLILSLLSSITRRSHKLSLRRYDFEPNQSTTYVGQNF